MICDLFVITLCYLSHNQILNGRKSKKYANFASGKIKNMAKNINIQAQPTEVNQNQVLILKIRMAIATGHDELLPDLNNQFFK